MKPSSPSIPFSTLAGCLLALAITMQSVRVTAYRKQIQQLETELAWWKCLPAYEIPPSPVEETK